MLSTYRAHANECIAVIMALRHNEDIFPLELIQMIIKLYWKLYSTPVLVLFTSNSMCCKNLIDIWYPPPAGRLPKEECFLHRLAKIYPDLRFVNISCDTQGLGYSEQYPLAMSYYIRWFPMILLVPGPMWDHAMLYPESDIELIDGVQIFNGIWEDKPFYAMNSYMGLGPDIDHKILMYRPKYDIRKVDDFMQWFTESVNNPGFIAAQNKLM